MNRVWTRLGRPSSLPFIGSAFAWAALILPVLWIALIRDDRAIGDVALIELRIRDVFSGDPPLVGAYSRYGWSHPGPLMFFVFAVPFRLFGNDADALRLTALIFNAVVIGTTFWLASRRGLSAQMAVIAATTALAWGLLPNSLSDGWNVTVALMPFLLTVVACWCAASGDRWALLVACLAFSFVFQAHVGFGLVLVPLLTVTLVHRAFQTRDHWPESASIAVPTAVVGVTFLPVIYDLVAHWPGNLIELVKWSASNDEPTVGLADGLRMIGRTSSLSFPVQPQFPGRFVLWIDTVTAGFLPGTSLVLLAAGLAVSVRRRWRNELLLCVAVTLVWVGGLVAAANISAPLLTWLIDWLQPLGWITWAAVALVGWRCVQPWVQRQPAWVWIRSVGTAVVALALLVGTVAFARHQALTDYQSAPDVDAIDTLTAAAATLGDHQPISFTTAGDPYTADTMMGSIVDLLDASGFESCVDPSLEYRYGSRACVGPADRVLMVRSESFVTPAPDGSTTLAISDPLTEAERTEADTISEELAAVLVANGREDQVALLYSNLVLVILDEDTADELKDRTNIVHRLHDLRQIAGTRYGLYLLPGPATT